MRAWKRIGDAITAAMKENATVDDAERLILEYKEMREKCLSRTSCVDCEYYKPDAKAWRDSLNELSACSRITTDDVIEICAAVYLRESRHTL